jgi:hypothetical protein
MRILSAIGVSLIAAVAAGGEAAPPGREDPAAGLDSRLVLATLKVSSGESAGTGFVLRREEPGAPARESAILVTADHVLSQSKGDAVTLLFHRREADGGFAKRPADVPVRRGGKTLWAKHPEADVAVLRVTPPPDAYLPRVAASLLATDADLQRFGVHPGDTIRCVGFPHPNQFDPNGAGFGVVRAGCLASFPLLPTKRTKTFLFDFNTFEGDSGSPVYLADAARVYGGKPEPRSAELILGLVTGQHFIDEEFKMIYQAGKFRHRMGMGVVVHASAIREAIDLLPAEPQ